MTARPETARADFAVKCGDTFLRTIEFEDDSGNPINVELWSFNMAIRPDYEDDPLLTDADGITISAESNRVTIRIEAEDTAIIELPAATGGRLPSKACIYDFVATDEEGNITTELEGAFVFEGRVTR